MILILHNEVNHLKRAHLKYCVYYTWFQNRITVFLISIQYTSALKKSFLNAHSMKSSKQCILTVECQRIRYVYSSDVHLDSIRFDEKFEKIQFEFIWNLKIYSKEIKNNFF